MKRLVNLDMAMVTVTAESPRGCSAYIYQAEENLKTLICDGDIQWVAEAKNSS